MREKLTLQQREYEAQQQLRQHVQEFIDKFRYNAKRASMVQSRIKMLEKMPILRAVEFELDVVLRFPTCEKVCLKSTIVFFKLNLSSFQIPSCNSTKFPSVIQRIQIISSETSASDRTLIREFVLWVKMEQVTFAVYFYNK